MKKSEQLLCTKDRKKIFYRCFEPDTEPRAVIALVHGFGEHSGRYVEWAQWFCEQEIALCAIDLRGHGQTPGKRGYTGSYELIMDDINQLIETVRAQFSGIPIILYGHSMGGNLVLHYAANKLPNFDLLVASSPWLLLAHKPQPIIKILGQLVRPFWPSYIYRPHLSSKYMTRDVAEEQQYDKDPLNHGRLSLQLYFDVDKAGKRILSQIHRVMVPTLIMHGTADRVTSTFGSIKYAKHTSHLTTLKLWEGGYHELHKEPNRHEIFEWVLQWINTQIALLDQ